MNIPNIFRQTHIFQSFSIYSFHFISVSVMPLSQAFRCQCHGGLIFTESEADESVRVVPGLGEVEGAHGDGRDPHMLRHPAADLHIGPVLQWRLRPQGLRNGNVGSGQKHGGIADHKIATFGHQRIQTNFLQTLHQVVPLLLHHGRHPFEVSLLLRLQGLVNVPFWVYWTSPKIVAIIDHIPNGWVMFNGDI